ncbi:hypothetical protein [Spirulina subsalsa]|uniref:hypothetical protein n=1 Tax=Spirulina subsalsa TaxID=54311 RepID=UPI00035D50CA|nr:hypothetical protein [Spirulina subsalsa]
MTNLLIVESKSDENYLRYDTCNYEERSQAGKKCSYGNLEYIMKNKIHIWNLEHPDLEPLKFFLALFEP